MLMDLRQVRSEAVGLEQGGLGGPVWAHDNTPLHKIEHEIEMDLLILSGPEFFAVRRSAH